MKALWGRVAIALAVAVIPRPMPAHAGDGAQDLDPKTIRSVKVPCDTGGGPTVMGRLGCDAQFKAVTALTRKRISAFSWNYYHGKIVDQATGQITPAPTPSCNLSAGETEANMFGQACGNLCEFKVHTSLTPPSGGVDPKGKPPEYCQREASWSQGALIQALNHYKEEVIREFKAKELKLVDYDGSRPCAEQAVDLLKLVEGRNVSESSITGMDPDTKPTALKCATTDGSGGNHAVCLQEMVNSQLTHLWDLLLICEVTRRSIKDAHDKIQSRDAMMNEAKSAGSHCADRAKCILCTDSTRSSRLNECYKDFMPKFLKKKFGDWWSTTEPLEKPEEFKGESQSSAPTPPRAPEGELPAGFMLIAVASLGGGRNERLRRFLTMLGTFAGIVLALSTFNFFQPGFADASCGACASGSCDGCNGCASCGCASSCMSCVDCPYILNSKLNLNPPIQDGNPDTLKTQGGGCEAARTKLRDSNLSPDDSKAVYECMNTYCDKGVTGGGPAGGTGSNAGQGPGAATGSAGGSGNAAPLANQAGKNLDDIAKLAGSGKTAAGSGGGAATAATKDKLPDPGEKPTAAHADGGAGKGGMNVGGGGGAGGGFGSGTSGAANGVNMGGGGAGGNTSTDDADAKDKVTGAATGFENAGAGGGGGGGGGHGAGSTGGVSGSGAAGGAGPNFGNGTGADGPAKDSISDLDFEELLKKNAGLSLFEVVNRRTDKFTRDNVR